MFSGSSLFRVGKSGAAVIHRSVSEQRRANALRFAAKSVSVRRAVPRKSSLLAAPLECRRKAPAVPLVLSHRPPRRLSDACRQTPSVGITLTNFHSQAVIRTPRLYPLGIARSLFSWGLVKDCFGRTPPVEVKVRFPADLRRRGQGLRRLLNVDTRLRGRRATATPVLEEGFARRRRDRPAAH